MEGAQEDTEGIRVKGECARVCKQKQREQMLVLLQHISALTVKFSVYKRAYALLHTQTHTRSIS